MKLALWKLACAITLIAFSAPSRAQDLPDVIKIVVPYPPGGPADITPRLIADKMTASTGRTFIIENRPGGASLIGIQAVLRGPKDGSNLLMCANTIALIPQLYRNSPYKLAELTPVSLMVRNPFALLVSPSIPAKSATEFVAYAKSRPDELRYGALGPGNTVDILSKWFLHQQKISLVEVPYKGLAQAEQAVMTGEVHMLMDALPGALNRHRSGQAKILGVTTEDRVSSASDIPTLKEQGLDFVNESWLGICAPAGVPKPVIDKLSEEIRKAVAAPDVQSKLKQMESIPTATTPDQLSTMLDANSKEWGKMIDALNLKMDAP